MMVFNMVAFSPEYLSKGIYTVPDAARLSRVSSRRIRYWLNESANEDDSEPIDNRLWQGQHRPLNHKLALGFYDLQEIRFIDAFLKAGVSWRAMRRAHDIARDRYETEHPFCVRKFVTDGKYILEEINDTVAGAGYEELIHRQQVFTQVITPFLKELEFCDDDTLKRWWPLGLKRKVLLDPRHQFGQPVIAGDHIPTEVLFQAVQAGQSIRAVAGWFETDTQAVRDAVDFEQSLHT